MTNEDIARAFSEHRFSDAYPFISPDVRWNVVGSAVLPGKTLLMRSCGTLLDELKDVDVEFSSFRVIAAPDTVVVDSTAHYSGDDASTVSSCDIYEFVDGMVATITSYNVEVEDRRAR